MIRLNELHGASAGGAELRWDQRSVDVFDIVQSARSQRAAFIADRLRRGVAGFGRWSGLSALAATLRRGLQRRRTLRALSALDDRLLSDIGVSRAEINATAALCCDKPAAKESDWRQSVWHKLASDLSRAYRRRKTIRELSAMSDELLADIGVQRSEIPAIAAALFVEQTGETPSGEPVEVATDVPVNAQVLAFIEVRRSLRRAANENLGRSSAA